MTQNESADLAEQIRSIALATADLRSEFDNGPVPEPVLCEVEAKLGRKLPPSFRAYLRAFAGGTLLGLDLFGITTEKAAIPNLNDETGGSIGNYITSILSEYEFNKQFVGEAIIPIMHDGGECLYGLDTSRTDPSGECPVVVSTGGMPDVVEVAASFLDFLEKIGRGDL